MIDHGDLILDTLKGNQVLIDELGQYYGSPAVFRLFSPEGNLYPRVTFFELNNFDTQFGDNKANAGIGKFQIDIWTKGNPKIIKQAVNESMESIGFFRTFVTEMYEEETKTIHVPMRYKKEEGYYG